jgi:hypothetical protein
MSGSNQHTIPQIMLRGFGRKNKAKAIQVTVYRQDKIFTTGTRGIGAERFFYSPLATAGELTLDDRITQYEARLNGYIEELRNCPIGADLPAKEAAETVVHLTIRTAQVRNSLAQGAGQVMQGAPDEILDPAKRWRLMGLHLPKPTLTRSFGEKTSGRASSALPPSIATQSGNSKSKSDSWTCQANL